MHNVVKWPDIHSKSCGVHTWLSIAVKRSAKYRSNEESARSPNHPGLHSNNAQTD